MRLSEKIVQEKALDYLRKRYRRKARQGKVFAKAEVRTRKKFGGKRADGLLAYRSWMGGMQVISLEAKSHKTLGAIRLRRNGRRLFWKSLLMGLYVCVGSGAFFLCYRTDDPWIQFYIPAYVLLSVALIYGYFRRNHTQYHFARVLDQLKQYPANKQWLAFSRDSLDALPKKEVVRLRKICSKRGFGMLVVGSRGKVERWLKPTFQRKWTGDFLQYYCQEKEIRRLLNA